MSTKQQNKQALIARYPTQKHPPKLTGALVGKLPGCLSGMTPRSLTSTQSQGRCSTVTPAHGNPAKNHHHSDRHHSDHGHSSQRPCKQNAVTGTFETWAQNELLPTG